MKKPPSLVEEGLVLELLFTPPETNFSKGDFTDKITNCFHINLIVILQIQPKVFRI